MPILLKILTIIGTAAMLWVGGSIILHGMDVLGMPWIYQSIHHIAVAIANRAGEAAGFVHWVVAAFLDGVFGLALGMALIPIVTRVLGPLFNAVSGRKKAPH
jgi:predicted DNA repair protein MutK